MSLGWAVIKRELGVEARKASTYRVRLGLGLLAVSCVWLALFWYREEASGIKAFMFLHKTVLVVLAITAPALAADCLSKERREGTLGLLLMTGLRPGQLIMAKFWSLFCKLLPAWLLAIPLAVVPLQQGGVLGRDIALSLIFQFDIAIVALAAAIYTSTTAAHTWGSALLRGYLVGLGACWMYFTMVLAVWYLNFAVGRNGANIYWLVMAPLYAWFIPAGAERAWNELIGPVGLNLSTLLFWASPIWCAWAASAFLRRAAKRVASFQEKEIETKRQAWMREVFLTPRFWRERFRDSMRRKLRDNPFIWLEYRTTASRVLPWLILLVLILIESFSVAQAMHSFDYQMQQVTMLWIVVLILGFKAAGSFQKERECGAFELILVTPLRVEEILEGRVRAVWRYYRMLFVALVVFYLLPGFFPMAGYYYDPRERTFQQVLLLTALGAIYTLPYLGLYFALRFQNFLAVLAPTIILPLGVPIAFWKFTSGINVSDQMPWMILLMIYSVVLASEAKKRGKMLLDQRSVA